MADNDTDLVLGTITITRYLTTDSAEDDIRLDSQDATGEELPYIEAIQLLEFAKQWLSAERFCRCATEDVEGDE